MLLMLDDEYLWTPGKKIVPEERLGIPGLHMIGRADFKKAWDSLDTHYHKAMEVVVVLNGTQQYVVNDTKYSLYGGKLFITYPYEIHGNGEAPQNMCSFIWFQIDLTKKDSFLGLSGERAEYLYSCISRCSCRTMDVRSGELQLLQEAWEMMNMPQKSKKMYGYTCFITFLTACFCDEQTETYDRDISPDMFKALQYIHANLTSDIHLADIANAVNISEPHFKSKFRIQFGITPMRYITSQRIELAKTQLRNSSESITDIALNLSFSSSNYFATVFKRYTGYSPSEFRSAKEFEKN